MSNIEERIAAIEARNKIVEADKAWETSLFRRSVIALLTYVTVVAFLVFTDANKPAISAMIPVIGYLLTTLVMKRVKNWWLHR